MARAQAPELARLFWQRAEALDVVPWRVVADRFGGNRAAYQLHHRGYELPPRIPLDEIARFIETA